MVKIALDPAMYHAQLSVVDEVRKAAELGYRYLELSPRADQHNEIGHGDLDWDEFFGALRDIDFDGVATVCVFGWEEDADAIHRRMLERVQAELGG